MASGEQVMSVKRKGFVGFRSSRESLAQGFGSSGRGREGDKGLALPVPTFWPLGGSRGRGPSRTQVAGVQEGLLGIRILFLQQVDDPVQLIRGCRGEGTAISDPISVQWGTAPTRS